MNVQNIYDETWFMTDSDSTTFATVDILRGLNINQGEAMAMVLAALGYKQFSEKEWYTDFVSSVGLAEGDNGYNGEFAFPAAMIKPTEIWVKFPGQTDAIQCAVDADEPLETSPSVHFARNTVIVSPLNTGATVSNGLRIFGESRQTDLATTSDVPVLDPIFHNWYVLKQALRFGLFRPGITRNDIMTELLLTEKKIKRFYSDWIKLSNIQITPLEEDFS